MKSKITLSVCRSCIRDNAQSDPCLANQSQMQENYEKKLKKGFFGKKAELKVSDCLTNCHRPNSVRIDREDGEILLGFVNDEKSIDAVIALAESLKNPSTPLAASEPLKEKLISVRKF